MKVYGSCGRSWQTLLEEVLKIQYGIPSLPEIRRTDQGKPYFPALPHLHFSVSHTGEKVLCALSEEPVGVDIEEIRPRREAIPRYALTPEEFRDYQALGGDWPAFYAMWTRKEAWCKYTGLGLGRHWGETPPGDLRYGSYAGEGWRAAVCGRGTPPEAILWLEGGAP